MIAVETSQIWQSHSLHEWGIFLLMFLKILRLANSHFFCFSLSFENIKSYNFVTL